MHQRRLHLLICTTVIAAGLICVPAGCSSKPKKPKTQISKYPQLPLRKVPPYLKDTILERTELGDNRPYTVSGFGLVANLRGTGNSDAPNAVREYIIKEMSKHKWGSKMLGPDAPAITAEDALRDPRLAIVRVDGDLPPGIREGQTFDVRVAAIPEGYTTSLSHGNLYQTDLRIRGASNQDPGGSVNVYARSQGPVFVNPAYALMLDPTDPAAKRSLRSGIIMDGGRALEDRPLLLRMLQPDTRVVPFITQRINQRFQAIADKPRTSRLSAYCVAEARDEATIHFWVPIKYYGDWEHFAGVVTHLYMNATPEFADIKARELADEAVKPDARLADISLAWEGLGPRALPHMRDLMSSDKPDVAFAASRAGAYLEDPTAYRALAAIVRNDQHPFQLPALQVLGNFADSPEIREIIRPLLESDQALLRLEAYRVLVAQKDVAAVFSKVVRNHLKEEPFMLDLVRSSGPPLIYATTRGIPRIAIIGDRPSLNLPLAFSAMGGRLTISSNGNGGTVTIFYRPPPLAKSSVTPPPIRVVSNPDLAEIIARLGGEGDPYATGFTFPYCDVVAILNEITQNQRVGALSKGMRVPATLMIQELPAAVDPIYAAPVIPDSARPQTTEPENVGLAK